MEAAKTAQSAVSAPPPDLKNDMSEPLSPQSALAALQSDVQPVGHDYVEEVSEKSSNREIKVTLKLLSQVQNIKCFLFSGKEWWRKGYPVPLQTVWMQFQWPECQRNAFERKETSTAV